MLNLHFRYLVWVSSSTLRNSCNYCLSTSRREKGCGIAAIETLGSSQIFSCSSGGRTTKRWMMLAKIRKTSARANISPKQERRPKHKPPSLVKPIFHLQISRLKRRFLFLLFMVCLESSPLSLWLISGFDLVRLKTKLRLCLVQQ